MSWGGPGTNPGEFNIVHNICTDADGWVYVADRENHRVQVFDGNGKYETQWNNLHRPCGLYMDYARHPVAYIGELGPVQPVNRNSPNLGPRVSIVDNQGKLLSRFGDMHAGTAPTAFLGPHGLTRGQPRRPLCRRGVVDAMAAILPGQAAARLHPLIAEIRAGALSPGAAAGAGMSRLDEALARLERAVARLEAACAGVAGDGAAARRRRPRPRPKAGGCAPPPAKSPPASTARSPGSAGHWGKGGEMSQVAVTVNGRPYKIACDDGQEPRIRRLAQYVDARVGEFVKSVGPGRRGPAAAARGARHRRRIVRRQRGIAAGAEPAARRRNEAGDADDAAASGIHGIAQRIEALAARLENP